jgi:hypothetical protein
LHRPSPPTPTPSAPTCTPSTARDGPQAIAAAGRRPAPRGFTPEQIAEVCHLAETAPFELGLPRGRWSLAKLRDYLLRERVCQFMR